MKTRLLVLGLAVCMVATPAMADLFTFTYGDLATTYNTGTAVFTAAVIEGSTDADVSRLSPPLGSISFDKVWAGNPEAFALSMNISNIAVGGDTADGTSGSFTLTDVDLDTITGTFAGKWYKLAGVLTFDGVMSNAAYTPSAGGETTFDGDDGSSISMLFNQPSPWPGVVIELTASGLNFNTGWSNVQGGGVTGIVVPVPAAVLLGFLGLGAAGLKLRRYA